MASIEPLGEIDGTVEYNKFARIEALAALSEMKELEKRYADQMVRTQVNSKTVYFDKKK